jgi:hypothetical protein
LRSLLSAAWVDDPYISPTYVWYHQTGLVPLSDPTFDQVTNFLTAFPAFVS